MISIDVWCLEDGVYLNDVIIQWYLHLLVAECGRQDVFAFSSYFYQQLTAVQDSEDKIRYDKVKKWTTRLQVDIFAMKYVFIPINER